MKRVLLMVATACASAGPEGQSTDGGAVDTEDASAIVGEVDAGETVDAAVSFDSGDSDSDAGACTIVPQSGCESGEACDLDPYELETAGSYCRDATAGATEESTCESLTDCEAGYSCLGNSTGDSLCMEYCEDDTDCTAPGGLCIITLVYGDDSTEIPGVKMCSQNCIPTSSEGCPEAWGCYVVSSPEDEVLFTMCDTAGTGDHGDSCTSLHDCAPGSTCVNTGPGSECLRWCNKSTGSGCSGLGGASCISTSPPAWVGSTQYGVCF